MYTTEQNDIVNEACAKIPHLGKLLKCQPAPQEFIDWPKPQMTAVVESNMITLEGLVRPLSSFLEQRLLFERGTVGYYRDCISAEALATTLDDLRALCTTWGWLLDVA